MEPIFTVLSEQGMPIAPSVFRPVSRPLRGTKGLARRRRVSPLDDADPRAGTCTEERAHQGN
jgi:hypothetical protein